MKREFMQNLKVAEEVLPKEVIDTIMEDKATAAKGCLDKSSALAYNLEEIIKELCYENDKESRRVSN